MSLATPATCENTDLTQCSPVKARLGGLCPPGPGNPHNMNEHVDWSAMSDDDFVALLRQLVESPEVDED